MLRRNVTYVAATATIGIRENNADWWKGTEAKLVWLTLGVSELFISWFTWIGFLFKGYWLMPEDFFTDGLSSLTDPSLD